MHLIMFVCMCDCMCHCMCVILYILSAPGILLKGSSGSQQSRLTPSHPHSHNSSITASPFNANILQALSQQQMTIPTNRTSHQAQPPAGECLQSHRQADHTHQPSPLVTSVTSTAPSQTLSSLSQPPHTQAPSTFSDIIGQLRPSMTAESAHPQAPPISLPTPSYTASTYSIPQLAANLVLSQGHHQQHQANALPHQGMATVYPMLQKSAALPNQTTLLSPQAALINPTFGYPFNPIMPAFGSFVSMQSYATSPVCLPGFLPGISSFYNPQAHTTQPVTYPTNLSSSMNLMGNTSLVAPKYSKWGGSVCPSPQQAASSSQQSHLQSVPPWFIFSDKRADSKVRE